MGAITSCSTASDCCGKTQLEVPCFKGKDIEPLPGLRMDLHEPSFPGYQVDGYVAEGLALDSPLGPDALLTSLKPPPFPDLSSQEPSEPDSICSLLMADADFLDDEDADEESTADGIEGSRGLAGAKLPPLLPPLGAADPTQGKANGGLRQVAQPVVDDEPREQRPASWPEGAPKLDLPAAAAARSPRGGDTQARMPLAPARAAATGAARAPAQYAGADGDGERIGAEDGASAVSGSSWNHRREQDSPRSPRPAGGTPAQPPQGQLGTRPLRKEQSPSIDGAGNQGAVNSTNSTAVVLEVAAKARADAAASTAPPDDGRAARGGDAREFARATTPGSAAAAGAQASQGSAAGGASPAQPADAGGQAAGRGIKITFKLPDGSKKTCDFAGRPPPLGLYFGKDMMVQLVKPGGHAAQLGVELNWQVIGFNEHSLEGLSSKEAIRLLTQVAPQHKAGKVSVAKRSSAASAVGSTAASGAGAAAGGAGAARPGAAGVAPAPAKQGIKNITFLLPDGSTKHVSFEGVPPPLGMGVGTSHPVKVERVKPGGHGDRLGVRVGWQVTHINGGPVRQRNGEVDWDRYQGRPPSKRAGAPAAQK